MKTNLLIRLAVFAAILLISTTGGKLFAQTPAINCANLGFDSNTFENWHGKTGTYTGTAPNPFALAREWTAAQLSGVTSTTSCRSNDPSPNRFVINSDTGAYDKNVVINGSNKILRKIPHGYTHSARLGNACVGAEAEALCYRFRVTDETALLTIMYAMVLEAPHANNGLANPTFDIVIREEYPAGSGMYPDNTTESPAKCTEYRVTADPAKIDKSDTTFVPFSGNSMLYRKWMPLVMNLSAFSGKNLEITISMGDCSYSGHYGYLYLAGRCDRLKIETGVYMQSNSDTAAVAAAPAGFFYKWIQADENPDDPNTKVYSTQQNVYLTEDDFEGKQSIQLTCYINMLVPNGGCGSQAKVEIENKKPLITLKHNLKCSRTVSFDSTSSGAWFIPLDNTTHRWDFGDGSPISSEAKPTHQYANAGIYTVSYSVSTIVDPSTGFAYTSTKRMKIEIRNEGYENFGFKNGDFAGWYGKTGTYTGEASNPFALTKEWESSQLSAVTSAMACDSSHEKSANRFVVNSKTDEYDKNLVVSGNDKILPKVPQGYTHSARIGNACVGAEAEALYCRFAVEKENPILTLMYAMVVDKLHPGEGLKNPTFDVVIREEISCGVYVDDSASTIFKYRVYSDPNLIAAGDTAFEVSDGVTYRKWMPLTVNLSRFAGKNVEIAISMSDCAFAGHYGYAYITGKFGSPELLPEIYAGNNDTVASATASAGGTYQWVLNGDDPKDPTKILSREQTIYLKDKDFGGKASIELNCYVDVFYSENVENSPSRFSNIRSAKSAKNVKSVENETLSWMETVTVKNMKPVVDIQAEAVALVVSFSASDTSYYSAIDEDSRSWNFGDGSTATQKNPAHTYATSGTYIVSYSVSDTSGYTTAKNIQVEVTGVGIGNATEISESLSLYPNPTNGIVNIESTLPIKQVEVLDNAGKILMSLDFKSQLRGWLNLEQYSKGSYLIRVTNSKGIVVRKIVRQ